MTKQKGILFHPSYKEKDMNNEDNALFPVGLDNTLSPVHEDFVRENLMSDQFLDFVQENTKPIDRMFAY